MTRISVVIPTNRPGGMDIVCSSLAAQTFREFELVLADDLYDRRHPIVASRLEAQPFAVKHVRPSGGPAQSNYSRSLNDAIVQCSGELVTIQTDYTWLPPDCLEKHWDAYESEGGRSCVMFDDKCVELPPLHPDFSGFGPNMELCHESNPDIESQINDGAAAIAAARDSGALDPFMWSTFAEPLTQEAVERLSLGRHQRKLRGNGYQHGDPNWCSLKNEAIPLSAFLDANGLDERFDGSHLYQDQEFATRVHRLGYRWTARDGATVLIVNPRTKMSAKRIDRPMRGSADSNEALMRWLWANPGVTQANPHRNLRAEREARGAA